MYCVIRFDEGKHAFADETVSGAYGDCNGVWCSWEVTEEPPVPEKDKLILDYCNERYMIEFALWGDDGSFVEPIAEMHGLVLQKPDPLFWYTFQDDLMSLPGLMDWDQMQCSLRIVDIYQNRYAYYFDARGSPKWTKVNW